MYTCVYRRRRGNKVTLLKLLLVLPFDVMVGLVHTHTQLGYYDKSVPHRQDFKENFQAPSLFFPDEFKQAKGEGRWN